jgi:hypothetical protein
MKILSITAGAAGMYCGSCARDNSLAAELIRQGHDVILAPVYTPTRTDEPNMSQRRVLFGGISVYLQQYVPMFRRSPRFIDRLQPHSGRTTGGSNWRALIWCDPFVRNRLRPGAGRQRTGSFCSLTTVD